jgi:glycosyltransferase involved in cell wall biosynthesis
VHVLLVNHSAIPVFAYGGTERVIWDLAKCLVEKGHQVSFLVPKGSTCPFAQVIELDPHRTLQQQIPADVDLVHFQFNPGVNFECGKPWLMTQHGNSNLDESLPLNTVFVSGNHAERHGAQSFVYNGLDWRAYGPADLDAERTHFHFLGKAMWRVKNVQGAIDVSKKAHVPLAVMGGTRLNIKRGFRFTWSRNVQFLGMVGGETKFSTMRHSRGLIFPVRWHEPFGLAVIESLYFGCPVFATPYGALPEIVTPECGVLSNQLSVLTQAVSHQQFDRQACHARAVDFFNADRMTDAYVLAYQKVMEGEVLNATSPVMTQAATKLAWLSNA